MPLFGAVPLAVAVGGVPARRAGVAPPGGLAVARAGGAGRAGPSSSPSNAGELLLPAVLLTAVGLGACLASAGATDGGSRAAGPTTRAPAEPDGRAAQDLAQGGAAEPAGRRGRRGYAAVAGMLVFAVAAVAYYAAYDLGYPNAGLPVAMAVLVAAVALGDPVRPGADAVRCGISRRRRWPATVRRGPAGLTALAAARRRLHVPPAQARATTTAGDGRVAAYNIRMGFGLDGRLRPGRAGRGRCAAAGRGGAQRGGPGLAAQRRPRHARLLAGRLGMPYVFAPAADPVWGDAVLSRCPCARGADPAAAGASARRPGRRPSASRSTSAGGVRLAVVATHLQPPPGQDPVESRPARSPPSPSGTRPAVPWCSAGDLNTEPGDPAFAEFTRAGLVDALAAARPLPTSPADDPRTADRPRLRLAGPDRGRGARAAPDGQRPPPGDAHRHAALSRRTAGTRRAAAARPQQPVGGSSRSPANGEQPAAALRRW